MKGSAVADLDLLLGSKQRFDYTSTSNTIYYGMAAPTTLTSDARWQIRRETLDASGRTTQVDFAGGTVDFNQVWDNRVTLTYS